MGEVAISKRRSRGRRAPKGPIVIRRSSRSKALSSPMLDKLVSQGHPNTRHARKEKRRLESVTEQVKAVFKRHQRYESKQQKQLRDIIGMAPGKGYSEKVMRTLFTLWADNYDNHMADHEVAIAHLIHKALDLDRLNSAQGLPPIFGRRVLEMSCGTGTVLDLMSKNVSEELARNMIITANDITPEMQVRYARKLQKLPLERMPEEVSLTNQDLRAMTFSDASFDTIVLSQTLHLITDPQMMEMEREAGFANGGEHRQIKLDVIRKAFELLAENGVFIMIDEWPATLSVGEKGLISSLFEETFRPIVKRYSFRKDIMGGIPGARLEAELKAKIDPRHNMYVLIYRKDPDKLHNRGRYCPEDWTKKRQEAADRLVERFMATDSTFIESFAPEGESNRVQFSSIYQGSRILIDEPVESIDGKYDTIILKQNMHGTTPAEREMMIAAAVDALNLGGALMVIDEWNSPQSVRHEHMLKSHLRGLMATRFERNIMFEGTLRVPIKEGYDNGMYGFLYRKIAD